MRTLPLLLLLTACEGPDLTGLFNQVDLRIEDGAPAANAAFIDVIGAADTTLLLALPGITDMDITDAVLAAWDRGVDVRVAVDFDHAADAGIQALTDAEIPLRLADAGVAYFDFGTNTDVAWDSTQTAMTHSFAVADTVDWVMANGAGDLGAGTRLVFAGHGEDIGEDLTSEHIQIFGGSDATATTAFSAMAKSIADARWSYNTQDDEILQVWFNPQERGVKRIIDAIYRAKSSIRIMAEDVSDEGLARALQRKAEDGFDVEVLVGASFGSASAALSDVLRNQAPDVPLLQVATADPLPTIAFIDYDRALDGRYHMPRAMMLTHPMWSAARIFAGVEVINDQLVDGALYVLEVKGEPTAPLQDLAAIYQDKRALAEALR